MKLLLRRAAVLALTALVLYGVAPAVVSVLGAWPRVRDLHWWWLLAMLAAQVGSLACLWHLQALAIGTHDHRTIATSQLAGGALGRVIPGGAATAAAAQFGMLAGAGIPRTAIATGLAVATALQVAALCLLPLLALPAVIFGLGVPGTLLETAALGLGLFAVMMVVGFVLARSESILRWVGRTAVTIGHRLPGRAHPGDDLPDRLLAHRNEVLARLGSRLPSAAGASIGRWLLDLLTLVAAVVALESGASLWLVLLAYVGAQLLGQIPVTPGGIGVVEAALTATLTLAGLTAGEAAIATLAYRLASYWLMIPAGLVAWVVHRRHLGRPVAPDAV